MSTLVKKSIDLLEVAFVVCSDNIIADEIKKSDLYL